MTEIIFIINVTMTGSHIVKEHTLLPHLAGVNFPYFWPSYYKMCNMIKKKTLKMFKICFVTILAIFTGCQPQTSFVGARIIHMYGKTWKKCCDKCIT